MSDERSARDHGGGAATISTPPAQPGLLRSIAHRLVGDADVLPVEGHLASFDGATGWLNSEPLTPEGLRGRVVLVDFWTYTCINWLRTAPYLRAWDAKYRDLGLDRDRRPHARVRLRAQRRQRRRAVARLRRRVPGRDRQRLRGLAGVREPLLAGRLHRGRRGPHPLPPLRRGRVRDDRDGRPAAAARGRARRASTRISSSVDPQGFEVAADWSTLRTPETYVGYGRSAGFASPSARPIRRAARLPRARTTRPQPVGAVGRLDARAARRGAERGRRAGSRSGSRPATSTS